MASFGKFETNEPWSPTYGGVDWKLRHDRLVESGELDKEMTVGFDSGDGLVMECHQENTAFYINEVDPDMNMYAVHDPRDKREYLWFREDNPDRFEDLVKNMGHAALMVYSRYPTEQVVAVWLDRRSTGIDTQYLEPLE